MKIEDLFNVSGKVAIVTGGSRGIGEMIAAGFLANGVKVYITARKEAALIEKAKELCPSDVFILSRYVNLLIYLGEFDNAFSELKRAMRLDPFSHDLLFGPEAICHYWLDNYDLAMQSVSKIKIARTHLFYLSLILFKKNELSEASKKLKEAVAITDMDFQAFVNSEPYKDEENIKKLIQDFHSIENY